MHPRHKIPLIEPWFELSSFQPCIRLLKQSNGRRWPQSNDLASRDRGCDRFACLVRLWTFLALDPYAPVGRALVCDPFAHAGQPASSRQSRRIREVPSGGCGVGPTDRRDARPRAGVAKGAPARKTVAQVRIRAVKKRLQGDHPMDAGAGWHCATCRDRPDFGCVSGTRDLGIPPLSKCPMLRILAARRVC